MIDRNRRILLQAWYLNGTGLMERGQMSFDQFTEINEDFKNAECSYQEANMAMKEIINCFTPNTEE